MFLTDLTVWHPSMEIKFFVFLAFKPQQGLEKIFLAELKILVLLSQRLVACVISRLAGLAPRGYINRDLVEVLV